MTHCPVCKAENGEDARFCASCGGHIAPAVAPVPPIAPTHEYPSMRGMTPPSTRVPEPHYASMRGMAVVATAEQEVRHLATRVEGVVHAPAGTQFAVGKNPQYAMAFSFFLPGGGQFYNGDMKKGLAVFALAIFASCLTIYGGVWFLGIPLSIGNWGWSIIDAGKVARREKALG